MSFCHQLGKKTKSQQQTIELVTSTNHRVLDWRLHKRYNTIRLWVWQIYQTKMTTTTTMATATTIAPKGSNVYLANLYGAIDIIQYVNTLESS